MQVRGICIGTAGALAAAGAAVLAIDSGAERAGAFPPFGDTLVVEDDTGHSVRLTAPARRIVSLIPAVTEILFALGAEDRIVGRTRFDDHPAAARSIVSVGDGIRPSLELVVTREPDLVVLFAGADNAGVAQRLRGLGIQTLALTHNSLADLDRNIERLGRLTGCRSAATRLRTEIRGRLDRVAAAVAGRTARSIYYDIWDSPPITVGASSYIDELIRIAGGRNIFSDLAAPSPQVSLEAIAVGGAELVIWPVRPAAAEERASPASRPGWRAISAVASGQVMTVDADLVHRLGPRVGDAAAELARAIHPGAAPRLASTAGEDDGRATVPVCTTP